MGTTNAPTFAPLLKMPVANARSRRGKPVRYGLKGSGKICRLASKPNAENGPAPKPKALPASACAIAAALHSNIASM